MARIKLYARKDKRDQEGTIPVYVRIAHASKTKYVSLGIRVKARHWNENKGEVRKGHPQYEATAAFLQARLSIAREAAMDLLRRRPTAPCSALGTAVRKAIGGPTGEGDDFLEYCQTYIARVHAEGRAGSWKRLRTVVEKLQSYNRRARKSDQLPFERLTVSFLEGFRADLGQYYGNAPNTATKNMAAVRTMLYAAIREGLFPQEKNPFFQITLKTQKTEKEKLSRQEMRRLEALDLDSTTMAFHARNTFVFAYYAGGMRFSDVCLLVWDNIREVAGDLFLDYRMKKTGERPPVPLVPGAVRILRLYEGRQHRYARVFPLLDRYSASELRDPVRLQACISSRNVVVNQRLNGEAGRKRGLQQRAGIRVHLTFHLARHSFAAHLREAGWDIYSISKAMGHANVAVTERYLAGFREDDIAARLRETLG